MAGLWDEEWEWRCGRLDEGKEETRSLFGAGFVRMEVPDFAMPSGSPTRRVSPDGRAPFHLHHGRPITKAKISVPIQERVKVHPDRQYVTLRQKGAGKKAVEIGGNYDRRARCWWVPTGAKLGQELAPAELGRVARGRKLKPGAALEYQRYIERMTEGREDEVEADAEGPIMVGNLGVTRRQRLDFWSELERATRPGGRVQMRITAELPYWVTPEERRQIVEAFATVFEAKRLPHWLVVHRPEEKHGSDQRNFHLHAVYFDRPGQVDDGRWQFDPLKDRSAQGPQWVKQLRQALSDAVNEQLDRRAEAGLHAGRFRYHPGRYADLGIESEGSEHLGPRRAALERSGVPTLQGVRNGQRRLEQLRIDSARDEATMFHEAFWARSQAIRVKARATKATSLAEAADRVLKACDAFEAATRAAEGAEVGLRSGGRSRLVGWANDAGDLTARPFARQRWCERELAKRKSPDAGTALLERLKREAKDAEMILLQDARSLGLEPPGLSAAKRDLLRQHNELRRCWRELRDEAEKQRLQRITREEAEIARRLKSPRFGKPLARVVETPDVIEWRQNAQRFLDETRRAEAVAAFELGVSALPADFASGHEDKAAGYRADWRAMVSVGSDRFNALELLVLQQRSRLARLLTQPPATGYATPEERQIVDRRQQQLVALRRQIQAGLSEPPRLAGGRQEAVRRAAPGRGSGGQIRDTQLDR